MPFISASFTLKSEGPNFTRDQVSTLAELETFGNVAGKTPIDVGHITFVVEKNQHYTYKELSDNEGHLTGEYGWVPFVSAGNGEDDGGGTTPPPSTSSFAYFKSLVFKRASKALPPSAPEGGDFMRPVPEGWEDGIPEITVQGEETIWMSTRVFSSAPSASGEDTYGNGSTDPLQGNWTEPKVVADSYDMDYEFCDLEVLDAENLEPNKQTPQDVSTNAWSNTATQRTVWMAMRRIESGAYLSNDLWEVVKIKGEKGEDGANAFKIRILDTLNSTEDLPNDPEENQYLDAYLVNDRIYVWDGDSWDDSGKLDVEYDETKEWVYLHIKYSDDGHAFTSALGEIPGRWVGTYCDYSIVDSLDFDRYFWKNISGEDAYGKEEIFYLTNTDEAPDVPTDHENSSTGKTWLDRDFVPVNWYDDFPGLSEDARYCWYCSRRKVDGVWDDFRGEDELSGTEGGVAKLYNYLPQDSTASSASRSFMVYTWTAEDPDNISSFSQPIVPDALPTTAATWDVTNNVLVWATENSNKTDTSVSEVQATWAVNPGNRGDKKYLWMSTATFSEALSGNIFGTWSDPVCLSGEDGRPGTDGQWKAFAYRRCENQAEFRTLVAPTLNSPYKNSDDFDNATIDAGWKDHPEGISKDYPIEAASIATRDRNTEEWTYGAPFIWSRWGEDGIDGDGIEYLYIIAAESEVQIDQETKKVSLNNSLWLPVDENQFTSYLEDLGITAEEDKNSALTDFKTNRETEWEPNPLSVLSRWTDDPSDVGPLEPYEFVAIRKYKYNSSTKTGEWSFWSEPALWAKYGANGYSVFTSIVFCRPRRNYDLHGARLSGGIVSSPIPTSTIIQVEVDGEIVNKDLQLEGEIEWFDSVPPTPVSAPVWMASRIFKGDEETSWSSPIELHDAPGFQVEYTSKEKDWDPSALPSLNDYIDLSREEGINEENWRTAARTATGATWGDIGTGGTDIIDPWWMITSRRLSSGVWTSWAIHKIKGEKGEPGTSISVKGNFNNYTDLGDPSCSPAGQVDHSSVSMGDCYVINGLLWIYDGNEETEISSGTYTESYITNPIENGNKYAGFSCQGQFKGDPGTSSYIFVRFANKIDSDDPTLQDRLENGTAIKYSVSPEIYIGFTENSGNIPGKYSGIGITSIDAAPTGMSGYVWSEWRGDDLYGTEQIFILSENNPCPIDLPNDLVGYPIPPAVENANEDLSKWYTFNHVPTGWSDRPLEATADEHCWVSTRRLSDPDGREWGRPVIYSRYAKEGHRGEDGAVNEFIYHRSENKNNVPVINLGSAKKGSEEPVSDKTYDNFWSKDLSRDYCPSDGTNDGFWTDSPLGIDENNYPVEFYAYRTREYDSEEDSYYWSSWSPVKVWSAWGSRGADGDGVEYVFTCTPEPAEGASMETVRPGNPTLYIEGTTEIDTETEVNEKTWEDYDFVPAGWSDDPQEMNLTDHKVQWVSIRRSHYVNGNTVWGAFSDPTVWSVFAEDGKDGSSIEYVYYLAAKGDSVPGLDLNRAIKGGSTIVTRDVSEDSGADAETVAANVLRFWKDLDDYRPGLEGDSTKWWSDSPSGIAENYPIEYYSRRVKKTDSSWGPWSDVMVWSKWGDTGRDGDGVEYIFRATTEPTLDINLYPSGDTNSTTGKEWKDDDFVPTGWSDDPPQRNNTTNRHIWVSKRKSVSGSWGVYGTGVGQLHWSDPVEWISYIDSVLEQRVYHYGGKTQQPILVQWTETTPPERPEGYENDDYLPSDGDNGTWTLYPQGITEVNRYEWEAVRKKNPNTGIWGNYVISPNPYTAWGNDGNGIEFVFWLITEDQKAYISSQASGVFPFAGSGEEESAAEDEYRPYINLGHGDLRAEDEDAGLDMTAETPYIYASKRVKRGGVWQSFGKIFIFNQLNLAPDYACTLNLSEDFQGVAVIPEVSGSYKYKSVISNVSAGSNIIELKYGPSDVEIGKVSIEPISLNSSGIAVIGSKVDIWETSDGSGNSQTVSVDGNSITFNVSKSNSKVLFSWGSSSNLKFKEKDSAPANLSFIVYAEEDTDVNPRSGVSTFNIHPIVGEVVYELDPKVDIFKKQTSAPYNKPETLTFEIIKNTYSDGSASNIRATYEDWNSGDIVVKYKKDNGSEITISGSLSNVTGKVWKKARAGSGEDYSWEVRGYNNSETKKVVVAIILGNSSKDFTENIQDGITVSLYYNNSLHDSEFVPAVYDGKKGSKGDYWKYENAYFLKDTESAPAPPTSNPTDLVSGGSANNNGKWLNAIISPDSTYRFLYTTKRLVQYYGDSVDDNGNTVTPGSKIPGSEGAWEDVVLYASVSLPGDPGRGIDHIEEWYLWTNVNSKPQKDDTGWTRDSIQNKPGDDYRWLWNYEKIVYTPSGSIETGVALLGSYSKDITDIKEYYFWSHKSTLSMGTYTVTGNNAVPSYDTINIGVNNDTKLASWWDSDHQTELELQSANKTRCYLWNFEKFFFSDNTTLATGVSLVGSMARSVNTVHEYYKWSSISDSGQITVPAITAANVDSSSTDLQGWSKDTIPTNPSKLKYLWNFEVIVYSYGEVQQTPAGLISSNGDDGRGIASVVDYYFWSHRSTVGSYSDGGNYVVGGNYAYPTLTTIGTSSTSSAAKLTSWWDTLTDYNRNALGSQITNTSENPRRYLWNFEVVTYDDENHTTESTRPALIAVNGVDGSMGNGIQEVREYYLWTSGTTLSTEAQNAITGGSGDDSFRWPDTSIWTENTIPSADGTKPYLWNFEILTYTTSGPTRTTPAIISSLGKGIDHVTEYYQWSSENGSAGHQLTPSSGTWYGINDMALLASQASESNKYLWNYEAVYYSDAPQTAVNSTPIIISIRGAKGDDGKDYQYVYFLSKNLLDNTSNLWTEVAEGQVIIPATGNNFEEVFPCWRYGSGNDAKLVSAHTSGDYTHHADFGIITDDPSGVSVLWPYEYESQGRTDANGDWHFSIPALKNNWAQDGEPGVSEYFLYKKGPRTPAPSLPNNGSASIATMTDSTNGWSADRASVTASTDDNNPVVWATSALVSVIEIKSSRFNNTIRSWSTPTKVYEKAESLPGPTVRGPVRWEDAVSRRKWLSGKGESGFTDSDKWIDIVTRTTNTGGQEVTNYYICKKAHTHTGSTSDAYVPGRSNSEYWDNANAQYKFVATEVLLAENAKIKALSNNALYLMDGDGDIVGGAKGSTSNNVADKDVIFWAGTNYPTEGSNLASAIGNAKFKVTYGGEMTSTAGTIGGWTIGSNSLSATNGTVTAANGAILTNSLPEVSLSGTSTETYSVSGIRDVSDFTMKLTASGIVGSGTTTTTLRLNNPPTRTVVTNRNLILSLSEISFTRTDDQNVANWNERLYQSRLDADGLYVSTSWAGGSSVEITATGIVLHDTQSGNKVSLSDGRIITKGGNIETDGGDIIADGDISASGSVTVGGDLGVTGEARISGSAYLDAAHSINGGSLIGDGGLGKVVSTHGKLNLKIAIITDDTSLFTHDSEHWLFNGDSLEIPYDSSDILSSSQNQYVIAGNHDTYFTGIFDSSVDRRGTTIYIEI